MAVCDHSNGDPTPRNEWCAFCQQAALREDYEKRIAVLMRERDELSAVAYDDQGEKWCDRFDRERGRAEAAEARWKSLRELIVRLTHCVSCQTSLHSTLPHCEDCNPQEDEEGDPIDDEHWLNATDALIEDALSAHGAGSRPPTGDGAAIECPYCRKQEHETNHPPGMVFVGWGIGWQTCPKCGGSARVPASEKKP